MSAKQFAGLDVEVLADTLDAVLPESFVRQKPGNRVRAKAIAHEYAARIREAADDAEFARMDRENNDDAAWVANEASDAGSRR